MKQEYIIYSGQFFRIEWYFNSNGKSLALEYFENLSFERKKKIFHLFKTLADAARISMEVIMNKKITSTYDRFLDSLSPEQKSEFERKHEHFLLEEMLHAAMKQDNISVRRLAKLVGVSPTIVQGIRSGTRKNTSVISFFKILNGLGYKLIAEKNGISFSFNIETEIKKNNS